MNSKKICEQVKTAVFDRRPDDKREVLIFAQDEGCFGRINSTKRCWSPYPYRPTSPKEIIRQYTYVYAAVCPKISALSALILPYSNTTMMSIFLKNLSEEYYNYFNVVILDKASWHKSNKLVIPENIRLIFLPPYSPELNPAEHLWDDIREKDIQNMVFKNFKDLEDTLCNAINRLSKNKVLLQNMTNFPYLNTVI